MELDLQGRVGFRKFRTRERPPKEMEHLEQDTMVDEGPLSFDGD